MANKLSKIPSIIERRYKKCKELSQEVFDQVEVNKNLYRGYMEIEDTYEWDYSLVDPHVFPLVRNYLARSNPSMTKIKLDARKPEDYEKRQINQDFLNWELGEILLTSLFFRMYFSGYVAGRGYSKTGWKYEKAIQVQETGEDGELARQVLLKDMVNRADAQFVRFNDILIPNRNIPLLHEQPYIIELVQMRVGDMLDENETLQESGEEPYWSEKWLKKLKKSGVEKKLLEYEMDRATDDDSKSEFAFRSAYVAMACMHTMEGDVFYTPLVDGEDDIVNNDTENRYWHGHYPYIDFCPFPEDDEFYSPGVVDVTGDLQIAATEILNQTLTNIRQINTDMWIAGTDASQTPDWQFQKRPSGVIRVAGDASQVQQVRTQDNTLSALRVAESLQSKIERAGGISSLYSSGAPSQNINQTARGAQIIDQNIDTNVKMIIDLFGEQVLKRLGEHFLELNAQYVTEEQTFAVTGKKGVRDLITIEPSMISANFDVSVNAERMIKQTPASLQANMQNLITTLVGQSNAAQVEIDFVPLFESLLDAYPEMENVEDVVISIDEKAERDIKMLTRGQMPEVKIRDQHLELVTAVNVWFTENQEVLDEQVAQLFEDYVVKHLRYIEAGQQAQQIVQPQQPPQVSTPPEGMGTQEGVPGQGYNLTNITR